MKAMTQAASVPPRDSFEAVSRAGETVLRVGAAFGVLEACSIAVLDPWIESSSRAPGIAVSVAASVAIALSFRRAYRPERAAALRMWVLLVAILLVPAWRTPFGTLIGVAAFGAGWRLPRGRAIGLAIAAAAAIGASAAVAGPPTDFGSRLDIPLVSAAIPLGGVLAGLFFRALERRLDSRAAEVGSLRQRIAALRLGIRKIEYRHSYTRGLGLVISQGASSPAAAALQRAFASHTAAMGDLDRLIQHERERAGRDAEAELLDAVSARIAPVPASVSIEPLGSDHGEEAVLRLLERILRIREDLGAGAEVVVEARPRDLLGRPKVDLLRIKVEVSASDALIFISPEPPSGVHDSDAVKRLRIAARGTGTQIDRMPTDGSLRMTLSLGPDK